MTGSGRAGRLRAAARVRALALEARLLGAAARLLAFAGLDGALRAPVPPRGATGPGRPLRVLLVCQGNICRSAYAEAALRSALAADPPAAASREAPRVEVVSAGLDTTPGRPADPTAIRVADRRGLDLRAHRTTPLRPETLATSDLVLAMEPRHLRTLGRRFPGVGPRPGLLGAFGLRLGGPLVIRDPFGCEDAVFVSCFDAIDRAVAGLACHLGASRGVDAPDAVGRGKPREGAQ